MKILLTMLSVFCTIEMIGFEFAYDNSCSYDLPSDVVENNIFQKALMNQTNLVGEEVKYQNQDVLKTDFEQSRQEKSNPAAQIDPFFEDEYTKHETRAVVDGRPRAITDDLHQAAVDTQVRVECPDFGVQASREDSKSDYAVLTDEQRIERADLSSCALRNSCKRNHEDVQHCLYDETEPEVKRIKMPESAHNGENSFRCAQCHYATTYKSALIVHMRTHTGEKPFECHQCLKRFAASGRLDIHMRTHSGDKPYSCDQCVKRFATKSNLIRHMITHTREKPYTCDLCVKRFAQQSKLITHRRTHFTQKPYKCDQCHKSFADKCKLITHSITHFTEKPYVCDQCPFSTSYKSNLISHKKIHTREQPCKCNQCDKQFAQLSALSEHMKTHIPRTEERPPVENNQ